MKIKKIIAALIITAIMVTQLFIPAVFGDVADIKAALHELEDDLNEDQKGLILKNLWDYVVAKIGDGVPITLADVDTLYDEIYNNLLSVGKDDDIISDTQTPGDGKIGKDSVKLFIEKLINNKGIIVDNYTTYKDIFDKALVKSILGLPADASAGEVYAAMLPYLVPILTMDAGQFVRNGDVSSAIGRKLGIYDEEIIGIILGDMNDKIDDEIVPRINNKIGQYGLTTEDVIDVLEIYDLYEENPSNPQVISTNPANGATGVSIGTTITITFSKDIYENKTSGSTYGNITLTGGGTALAINKSISGKTLTITPQSSLAYSTTYTVTVPVGAVTDEVMRPADGCTISFTTQAEPAYIPPSVPTVVPPTEEEVPSEEEVTEEEKEIGEIIAEIDEEEISAAPVEELDEIKEDLEETIYGATELLEGIEDPDVALELAKTLIEKSSVLVEKLVESGKIVAADEFSAVLNELAATILKKVATFRIDITEGAKDIVGEVKLGDVPAGELVSADTRQMLKDIVAMAEELTNILKDNGIEIPVKPVLYIDALSGAEGIVNSNVLIPAELLLAMDEEGLEEAVVMTDVATMNIPISAIEVKKGDKINIVTSKIDKNELPSAAQNTVGDAPIYKLEININDKKAEIKGKIKVNIPYTLKTGEDPEKITVFYVDEKGNLVNEIGVYDEINGTVTFEAEHFSSYVVKLNDVKFNDVGDKFWDVRYIEVLASKGIVKGSGTTETFKPLNNLTRAEFTAMIVRAFKLFDETAPNPFKDVKTTDWFYPEVTSAAKIGIVQGRPGGIFAPNDYITREEMAKIISNVLTLVLNKKPVEKSEEYLKIFSDKNNIADYAKDAVALATKYEILEGKLEGTYAPKDKADRAEASKVVYMMFYLK